MVPLVVLLMLSAGVPAATAPQGTYVAGGTAVVRADGEAPVDNGVVVCSRNGSPGVGGTCLTWGHGDSVLVLDALAGRNVAYQVCVDNNGDSLCKVDVFDPCGDDIFFSHSDGGAFHNPLGPLPKGFRLGCPGGFPGWVVLLCTGAHDDGATHAHPATQGSAAVVFGGSGYGNFCGPNGEQGGNSDAGKAYVVL